MAIKTYYYKPTTPTELSALLASGASPVSVAPTTDNPFLAVTVDDANKSDLDDAMDALGFEFVAEGTTSLAGKVRLITVADSPYTPGEELLILADASGGAVTIDLPSLASLTPNDRQLKVQKSDGTANAVILDATPDTINGVATFSLSDQYDAAEVVGSDLFSTWSLLLQPSTSSGLVVTTSVVLVAGNIVSYDTSAPSELVLTDPDTSLSPVRYDAKGVATAAALAGTSTTIFSIPGQRVPMLFSAAPAAASNGSRVFQSTTPGEASLVAPGSGNALVQLGILVGADGATTTPDVVFEFNVTALIA